MTNSRIILVGPDGSGKTTLTAKLAKSLSLPQVKFSQSRDLDDAIETTLDFISDITYASSVVDRIKTIDHIIYGHVIEKIDFSNEDFYRAAQIHKVLVNSTEKCVTIYLTGDSDTLWKRLNLRGDEDYIKYEDLDAIKKRYDMLFAMYHGLGALGKLIEVDSTDKTEDEVFEEVMTKLIGGDLIGTSSYSTD